MLIEQVKKLDPYGRLCYWITEREKIRKLKERGKPRPWTDDTILQSYRFCNVRRMDDAVSRWLLEHWYKPYFNHPSMILACVLARHFNQPSTLETIGFPDCKSRSSWDHYVLRSKERIERFPEGQTTFNAAYIIRADGKYPNKVTMVFDETVQQFVDSPTPYLSRPDYMEEAVSLLMGYRNIGSFMAGQIAADLRWAVKGEFKDKNTWAAMGPGSKRGMNRLQERTLEYPLGQAQFTEELKYLMKSLRQDIPRSITSRLEAIDYQNCLCEYDKMERTLFENRRPKQKYQGVTLCQK